MLVLYVNVLFDELLHDELAEISLLRLRKGSNIADYSLDAALLVEEHILVLVKYLAYICHSAAADSIYHEFLYRFGEKLADYAALFVVSNKGICKSISHIGAGLQHTPCLGAVSLGNVQTYQLFQEFSVCVSHFLPSSSERKLSTSLRFFSSSTFSPMILEAASIARSAISD